MADLTTMLSTFLQGLLSGGITVPTGGVLKVPDGTAGAPSVTFAAATDLGFYRPGGNELCVALGGFRYFSFTTSGLNIASVASGVVLTEEAANVLALKHTTNPQAFNIHAGYGGYWQFGSAVESMTLNTGGTTTDSAADLLPANAIIEAVVARVTTTITTATNWALGDPTTAARFRAVDTNLAAGTVGVGIAHCDQTAAAGPKQTAAAKLRITTTGTPGAGVIRVEVFFRKFVPPTS